MKLIKELRACQATRIYFDSNPFIYAVEGFSPLDSEIQEILSAADKGELVIVTSELTLAELLVKPYSVNDKKSVTVYEELLTPSATMEVLQVTREVLRAAARIRATVKNLRLPDAIHGATAQLSRSDALITNDTNFKGFTSVNVIFLKEFLGL